MLEPGFKGKLNPVALAAARRTPDITKDAAAALLQLMKRKEETKKEIQKHANAIRKLMEQTEKDVEKVKSEQIKNIDGMQKTHEARIQEMRDAQPELRNVEFSFNVEDGSFIVKGPREPDEEEPAKKEEAPKEAVSKEEGEAASYVKDYLSKLAERK